MACSDRVVIPCHHTVFVLAVAYRLVLTRLQALPKSLVEASFDLGAGRWQTLRYVLMPHLASAVMTGAVLARELRQIRADIPIILCTGFSHVIDTDKAAAQGIDAFLLKPLIAKDLGLAIQQVLSQGN